jgi:hypothetical protein
LHRGHEHNKEENDMAPELQDRSGLRLRLWLESRRKEEEGRQFASYEVVVPDLTREVKSESRF